MLYVNARFFSQEVTGVQRFAIELSQKLCEQRDDVVFLAPEKIKHNEVTKHLNVKVIGKNSGHFWEQYDLPSYLRDIDNPLLVNFCNTAPLFYKNKVITLHDVAYKRFPQSYSFKFRGAYNFIIPRLIASSRAVLTVSQFAKSELEHFFNLPKEHCYVVYNAASDLFHPQMQAKENHAPEKYFLAVASQQYHKNFEGLIAAFACLPECLGFKLKIVGAQHKNYQGVESILASSTSINHVEFLGRVDDDTLSELYRRAFAFVFPSFYEGFGIPPLEAQASGCPVIASSAAAMPEVLQDSVIYFDPYDRNSLVNALKSSIENQSGRHRFVEAGYKNAARFSWESSASCLNSIINALS